MNKIVIVEDEQVAAQNLQRLIAEIASEMEVVALLQTVEETVEYFSNGNVADLLFLDIHLADGLAFRIFDKVNIDCPIIFTTAYDQYALDAFKVNSIDYLLKPISKDDLSRAINKLRLLANNGEKGLPTDNNDKLQQLFDLYQQQHKQYKSYFLIPLRDKLVPLQVSKIAYVWVADSLTNIVTRDGNSYSVDKSLDAIASQLDPQLFFRANRQYIIAHDAIKDINLWPIGKLHISLSCDTPEKIIIPRARTAEFKDWYTR